MAGVKVRVTAGVGAWLLGATTATGLSLFAVSHLGTDVSGTQGSTLSDQDVNRALADAATPPPASSAPSAPTGSADSGSNTAGPAAPSTPTATPPSGKTSTDAGSAPPSEASASTSQGSATSTGQQAGTSAQRRLFGPGGQVVAQCQGKLVYLVSWSPAQGFQTGPQIQRGPAQVATVVFVDAALQRPWSMHVFCDNGTPVATTDDDGGGHDH